MKIGKGQVLPSMSTFSSLTHTLSFPSNLETLTACHHFSHQRRRQAIVSVERLDIGKRPFLGYPGLGHKRCFSNIISACEAWVTVGWVFLSCLHLPSHASYLEVRIIQTWREMAKWKTGETHHCPLTFSITAASLSFLGMRER